MQFVCKYRKHLAKTDPEAMKIKTFLCILLVLLAAAAHAKPMRPGRYTFTQPDGTTFTAFCHGDEFTRINTTTSGEAIVRDADGWWNYADYTADGRLISSGCHVGMPVSPDILSASRMIPYGILAARAHEKRSAHMLHHKTPVLSRTLTHKSAMVKGGTAEAITKHGLVILAQYADVEFMHNREDFVAMLTQEGYSEGGATGCAKEYFDDQFGGMFEFDFQVSEIVTLSRNRAYYGQNDGYGDDIRPAEMIREACELAHQAGTDFSLYDDDNDGEVDNVFVIFPGKDEADDPDRNQDCIWSHSWFITSGAQLPKLTLDGKTIDQYACTAELMRTYTGYALAGIGTFCHEFAHTLGLPDFYDVDYEENGGWAAGLWISTSLMDGGNSNNNSNTPPFLNSIERMMTGLAEPVTITGNGTYTLEPLHKSNTFYKLETDRENEYYLLECRNNNGWDTHIGGSGMLVYHIDQTNPSVWISNEVNCKPAHQHADLVEADGRTEILTESSYLNLVGNIGGIFFPNGSSTSLTPSSTPALKFWSGKAGDISIKEIKRDGNRITFNVLGFEGELPPTPTNLKVEAFMDAAILHFESDRAYDGEATIVWNRAGQEEETLKLMPYETGKYAVIFEGLASGNKTYNITVYFEKDGVQGENRKTAFMTSRQAPVSWPYIYLGKSAAGSGTLKAGTKVALRVYNAAEAEAIEWTFDGKATGPAGDGYFEVEEGGILKAHVYWKNGSVDVLEKIINVN